MNIKREVSAIYVSAFLFFTSLTQDGYYYTQIYSPKEHAASALLLLIIGWFGVLFGISFSWLANPALLLAYIFMLRKKYRYAAIASLFSVMLIVSFLWQRTILSNNDGTSSTITGYGVGYWLWLASAIIMVLSSLRFSVASIE